LLESDFDIKLIIDTKFDGEFKMAIKYVKGDLLADNSHRVLVHGSNAQGVMGSGIALQIKNKWPNVYEAYSLRYKVFGLYLGEIIPVQTIDGRVVINAITQENFGRNGVRYVDYDAIEQCFIKINDKVENWEVTEIGLPKIGAGLGGGDWNIIENIITKTATSYTPVVYDFSA
jgi:O-acetyl-ADP-ribose deacetylase (regulator of RNase III)